jgi:hypothetical protein
MNLTQSITSLYTNEIKQTLRINVNVLSLRSKQNYNL